MSTDINPPSVDPVEEKPATTTPVVDKTTETVVESSPWTKNKLLYIIAGLIGLLLLLLLMIVVLRGGNDNDDSEISNFDECVAAGYPVQESFPRKCSVPGGDTFTEEILEASPSATPTVTPTVEASGTPTPTPTNAPVATEQTVKVYFSKDPNSFEDPTFTVSVNRTSTRTDIGTFAIEQLIQGPTSAEELADLFTPVIVSGASNCGGKDFSLTVSAGKATLRFCKELPSAGSGDDARIANTIEKTLLEFSTVDEVVILTMDDHCFGDQSGMDLCKE